jgi:heme-degrading monooxygenase HmoA
VPEVIASSGVACPRALGLRRFIVFARIIELTPRPEMKDDILNVIREEVLPILEKQRGFLEFLPFLPESETERWLTVTLWADKRDAERWECEGYPKVEGILKFLLTAPPICNHFNVETSFCKHVAEALRT